MPSFNVSMFIESCQQGNLEYIEDVIGVLEYEDIIDGVEQSSEWTEGSEEKRLEVVKYLFQHISEYSPEDIADLYCIAAENKNSKIASYILHYGLGF